MIKDLREEGVSSVDIWGEVSSRPREQLSLQGPSGEKRPGKQELREEAAQWRHGEVLWPSDLQREDLLRGEERRLSKGMTCVALYF